MNRRNATQRKKAAGRRSRAKNGGYQNHFIPTSSPGSTMQLSTMSTPVSGGMPSRVRVTLCYVQQTVVSTTTIQNQVWRGNGPYDPDATGTGSQPYNYDDWATFYNRYRVHGCRIEQQYLAGANQIWGMYVHASNRSTAFTTYEDAAASPATRTISSLGVAPSNAGRDVLSMNCSTKAILGEDWGDRFQSLVNTTPGDPWYFITAVVSLDGGNPGGRLVTKLYYDVEFFDRNDLTIDLIRKALQPKRDEINQSRRSVQEENKRSAEDQLDQKFDEKTSPFVEDVELLDLDISVKAGEVDPHVQAARTLRKVALARQATLKPVGSRIQSAPPHHPKG